MSQRRAETKKRKRRISWNSRTSSNYHIRTLCVLKSAPSGPMSSSAPSLSEDVRAAIEAIPSPILLLEPTRWNIVLKNASFAAFLDNENATNLADISCEDLPSGLTLEASLSSILASYDSQSRAEWAFVDKSGIIVPASILCKHTVLNGIKIIMFMVDDAQREKKIVLDRFEHWENVFMHSSSTPCMIIRESDHSIVKANHVALAFLKMTQDEIVGTKFEEFVSNYGDLFDRISTFPSCKASNCTIKDSFGSESSVIIEGCFRPESGKGERTIAISLTLEKELQLDAKMEALVQKRVEEASKGVIAKSQYLAMMTHEIRTPAQAIVMIAELLSESGMQEPWRQSIETLKISTELLLTILNDVIDFSRVDSGKLTLEKRPFRPHSMLERTMDLLSPAVNKAQIDLLMDISPEVPRIIVGDSNRIMQIICNLVQNSVKFCERGGVIIISVWVDEFCYSESLHSDDYSGGSDHTSGSADPDSGSSSRKAPIYPKSSSLVSDLMPISRSSENTRRARIHFAVTDNGIGLDEVTRAKLFEPYVQAHKSTARKFGGSGLGLHICKKLCTQMNGKIWVESEGKGQGSSFHFSILFPEDSVTPVSTPSCTPEGTPGHLSPLADSTKKSEIVGIVSASEQALAVYGHIFSGWGWSVMKHPVGSARLIEVPHPSRLMTGLSTVYCRRASSVSVHKEKEIPQRTRRTSSLCEPGSELTVLTEQKKEGPPSRPTILVVDFPLTDTKEAKVLKDLTLHTVSIGSSDSVDIIVLTSPNDLDIIPKSIPNGSLTVLKKPVSPLVLRRCLQSVTKRKIGHLVRKLSSGDDLNAKLNAPTGSPVQIKVDNSLTSRKMKVLVADDFFFSQTVMKTALNNLGCECEIVEDGAAAVDAVARKSFDVVFMDIHMPVMDGFEATEKIRKLKLPRHPIICGLSASSSDEFIRKSVLCGMTSYLTKPVKIDDLRSFLKSIEV